MDYPIKNEATGRYKIYLNGEWRDSQGAEAYASLNPAHKSQILGHVAECTAAEIDLAMEVADQAFPSWKAISGNIKTKLFLHVANLLNERYELIVETMTKEMGKSHFDSRLDLDEAIGVVEAVAPQGLSMKGETYQTNVRGVIMESRPEPRGVAAIITPFNFPIAIPLAQVSAALVSGNTVVWKPSHLIPESSQLIAGIIDEAISWAKTKYKVEIPNGILNMVTGDTAAGQAIVRHPVYKALSFTGSKSVGDAVDAVASSLGKRVMKEVGGINCFYVHSEADIERAAMNFIYGKTITAGQRCTSIQEVLVDSAVYDTFKAEAIRVASGIVQGDGASSAIAEADREAGMFGLPPLVSEEQQAKVLGLIEQSVEDGGVIVYQKPVDSSLQDEGFYAPFTIIENVHPGNILYHTEIFGPVAVLTKVGGIADAIKIINDKIGIVGCIDSKNKDASETFIQNVLRTRIDDGRHGTGAFWATKFGGDRGAGSGNPALDEGMVYGYCLWKTIYRAYKPVV